MLLKDKNAIITGCNRGIGKAILTTFAKNGANIWACARGSSVEFESYIQDLVQKYNVEIWPIYFDLQNYVQMKKVVENIRVSKKAVDILVNNAGVTYSALFQMSTLDKMEEMFANNFFSPMIFTQLVIKLMLRNEYGNIVNIASTAGVDGNSGRSIYGASKAAMICATKSMAAELGISGIRVNAIAPGITQTEMLSSMSADAIQEIVRQTCLKRIGDPDDIAKACLFLASDSASYITGQVLRVDGGLRYNE